MATCSPERATVTIECRGKELTLFGNRRRCTVSVEQDETLWELQEALAELSPELIVLDLHLPIGFGAKLLGLIRETCPDVSVVTHVHSTMGQSGFFSVQSGPEGLILRPLDERSWRA